jgi:hypothetical protein
MIATTTPSSINVNPRLSLRRMRIMVTSSSV